MRRMIWPLVFGVVGTTILLALGAWQVQRLTWKQSVLAEIEARIAADPVPLPADPDPEADRYLPVRVGGRFDEAALDVLVSVKGTGPGYRIVQAFETEAGRRIMVDRGVVPTDEKDAPRPGGNATVVGNLHWPQEVDGFTPDPDLDAGIWFARDVPAMADALDAAPILIVARETTGDGVVPLPVGTENIPNDHLEYAITWFSLAAIWAGMTGFLLWRIRRQGQEGTA
ncbi:SURF1 family protein [Tranquillimonas alkanivorans]|uniref:SURF1-like protein n=1 Tax=Tranquillimonas alkanivorans TaxID=441119 RepID=A0A1I5M5S2_9RHOB|nr:SURF1 family protein [Tranquillimonas alkanivorans]SFP04988.1 surfeit locus 1 family protein [Tranquillimonas alkanivorans]